MQCDLHELTLSGGAPMPLGGEQRNHREVARDGVPGRQQVVDRPRVLDGAGDRGKPDRRIHRVVHLRSAVAPPHEVHHDQVVAIPLQVLVVEPAPSREVGDEHPAVLARGADQRTEDLLAARRADVDGDRTLALVQARPEQARAVACDRPTRVVEPAADRVEANHVGAELGERQPARASPRTPIPPPRASHRELPCSSPASLLSVRLTQAIRAMTRQSSTATSAPGSGASEPRSA